MSNLLKSVFKQIIPQIISTLFQ